MEEHTAKLIKGPYRVLLSIVLFLQMANCNVVGQILSFFFVDPIVECDEKYVSETTYQCDLSAMCKDKVPIKHIDALTFKNWATTFELYCDTSGYKVIVQTIYFVASGLFPTMPFKSSRSFWKDENAQCNDDGNARSFCSRNFQL